MASGDWRRKATSPESKVRNLPARELGRASLTRGNVGSSRKAGKSNRRTRLRGGSVEGFAGLRKHATETALAG